MIFIELLRASPEYTKFTVFKWNGKKFEQFVPKRKSKSVHEMDMTADAIKKYFIDLCCMYVRRFESMEKGHINVYLQTWEP